MCELPIPHPDLRESPLHTRRWTHFHRAAPLLRHEGYRNTTIKAAAGVCGVRPSTLYHYFPSKLAMALFPLSTESGLCDACDSTRFSAGPRSPQASLEHVVGHYSGGGDRGRQHHDGG